jgi:hypothetical protein
MFELVWIWIANPRENKIEKQLEIPWKKRKPIQPKPAQSSPAGSRAPVLPDRWAPPASGGFSPRVLPPLLPLPSGAALSAPVALTRATVVAVDR